MTYDYYGQRADNGRINPLVDYMEKQEHENWIYEGLRVELDPTVDYNNQNVLVRWTGMDEDFSDRELVSNLDEFLSKFRKVA